MTTVRQSGTGLIVIALTAGFLMATAIAIRSAEGQSEGTDVPLASASVSNTSHPSSLQPAEGARVAIVIPSAGTVFRGDSVPLAYELIKGKRGEHVHAYVDGELVGMFKTDRGTLNGIKPGAHTLELRVAAADHRTELDATDRVEFVVE